MQKLIDLERVVVPARSVPGMSVTQVRSRPRGLGDAGQRLSAGGDDQKRDERSESDRGT